MKILFYIDISEDLDDLIIVRNIIKELFDYKIVCVVNGVCDLGDLDVKIIDKTKELSNKYLDKFGELDIRFDTIFIPIVEEEKPDLIIFDTFYSRNICRKFNCKKILILRKDYYHNFELKEFVSEGHNHYFDKILISQFKDESNSSELKDMRNFMFIKNNNIKIKQEIIKIINSHSKKYFRLKVGLTCNNNCKYCGLLNVKNEVDKPFNEIKKVLEGLKDVNEIIFPCNSEIRKDFIDLLKLVRFLGYRVVLESNGRMFYYCGFVLEIKKYLDRVDLFLNGEEEIHDELVRVRSFKKLVIGIKNLINLGVDIQIVTVITNLNFKRLRDIVMFVSKRGIKKWRLIYLILKEKNNLIPKVKDSYKYIEKEIKICSDVGIEVIFSGLVNNSFLSGNTVPDYGGVAVKYEYLIEKKKTLKKINLNFSLKCNLKCVQCDLHKCNNRQELTTEQIKKIVLKLKKRFGLFTLKLSGSEPLMRNDLLEIIRFCSKNNIKVGLITNGSLVTEEFLNKIVKYKIAYFSFSLDGLAQFHDGMRGMDGLFLKVIKSLKFLQSKKIYSEILTIIMNNNLDEIIPLIEFVKKNNFKIRFQPILQPFGQKLNDQWYLKSELWPKNLKDINKLINTLIEYKNNYDFIKNDIELLMAYKNYFNNPKEQAINGCNVYKNNIIVDERGNIHYCFFMDHIGNILFDELDYILKSKKEKNIRKNILNCKKNCNLMNCHVGNIIKKVSVIISISNNTNKLLFLCLNSLFYQDYPRNKYEIILIDYGRKKDTLKMIKKLKPTCDLKYIYCQRNKIYKNGDVEKHADFIKNLSALYSSGEILLIMNPDVIAKPNLIREYSIANKNK
jgi:MoaA/NifB/PqqE/SkfB family radical SAM enzyme